MDTLDAITQGILLYGPAVVSIITMICTVIISIKRVTTTTKASLDEMDEVKREVKEVNRTNKQLKNDISALLQENERLKDALEDCINRMNHVTPPDDGSK